MSRVSFLSHPVRLLLRTNLSHAPCSCPLRSLKSFQRIVMCWTSSRRTFQMPSLWWASKSPCETAPFISLVLVVQVPTKLFQLVSIFLKKKKILKHTGWKTASEQNLSGLCVVSGGSVKVVLSLSQNTSTNIPRLFSGSPGHKTGCDVFSLRDRDMCVTQEMQVSLRLVPFLCSLMPRPPGGEMLQTGSYLLGPK